MAGAGDGDIAEARTEQIWMHAGIGVNKDPLVGAMARDGVALIEMAVLGSVELYAMIVVELGGNPAIGRDRFNEGKVEIGNAERFIWRGELHTVGTPFTLELVVVTLSKIGNPHF